MILWAAVMAVVAAEPAQGSSPGVWSFGELSGDYESSPLRPELAKRLGANASAVLGYGFQAGHARIVPSLGVSAAFDSALGGDVDFDFGLGVSLAVSATDLINEVHSGLRLSPLLAFSHHALPQLQQEGMTTQLNVGFALERRVGPVEISYTPRGRHYFSSSRCAQADVCLVPQWEVSQVLFAEAWVLPQLSFALGAWWTVSWGKPQGDLIFPGPYPPQHMLGGSGTATWAAFKYAGFTVDVWYGRALQWNARTYSYDSLVGTISFWLRTDAKIQRNWLER